MSTVPQWNADIITPNAEASAEIISGGGLEKDQSGAIGVNVDNETIVINQDGELQTNGGGGGGGTVDQTYDPTSTNAQSGTAVAGALASLHLNMFKAKYAAGTGPVHYYDNKYIAFWKDTSSTDNIWCFLCGSYLNETFKQDTNLLEILEANTPSVVYTGGMFQDCTSLTSVSLFDTSNVTDMGNMFNGCTSLTSVPLFDTSNVANMGSMFRNCSSLTSVPLFDTSKVTSMYNMFYGCTALTSVPLFDLSSATETSSMFNGCTALTSVPLFDLSSATKTGSMFNGCTALTSVPLFNLSSATNTGSMFKGCTSVETGALALYQQVSSQATPPSSHPNMFQNCGSGTVTGAAELAQIPTSWGGTMA